ncbi:MAG: hypothetical protein R2699_05405 [Acidimicrobiales bacterium]
MEVDGDRSRLYRSLRHTTTSTRCATAARSWTATARSCTTRTGAWARCCGDSGVKVFQIETTLNNDTFGADGPLSVLQKREWEWTAKDRMTFLAVKTGLDSCRRRCAARRCTAGRRPTA